MKNTKSSGLNFGRKITIQVPNDTIKATFITVSDRRKESLINISHTSHQNINSNRTINFRDIRRKEAYKKINKKLGEG